MKSTVGRPRTLTDEDIARIFAWHEAVLAWKAQRASLPTARELAKELNVSTGAIVAVIRRGQPKQASPEHRELERERRRERMKQIRTRTFPTRLYR
jgi:hypothetical protein